MNPITIHDYIERLGNLLRKEFRLVGKQFGLQPVQLEALHYLSQCNRYSDTPMAVTEYLGQTKGTVSQTLKVLEKKGYIRKLADNDDKRIIHLKITREGRQLISNNLPVPAFASATEKLDQASQSRIITSLQDLLHTLQQSNSMKSFGVCHSCRFNQIEKNGHYRCGLTQEPLSANDIQLICREHEHAA